MGNHYTKEEIVKSEFLFVSYKHEDDEGIRSIVNGSIEYLINAGVKLWYDADLGLGDKWTDIAKELIANENCVGVIFFNSKDAFLSNALHLERGYTLKKQEQAKNNKKPFFVFPINVGAPSVMLLLKEVFKNLPSTDKEIEKTFKLEYLQNIAALFESETIYSYADPNNLENSLKGVYDNIIKALPKVIDKDALRMKELEGSITTTSKSQIEIGICKNQQVNVLPDSLLQKDGVVELKDCKYVVEGGKGYSTKNIVWVPLYCENEHFVLLSSCIVGVRNGGQELDDWLKNTFSNLSFTEEETQAFKEIRLLSQEDFDKTASKENFIFSGIENGAEVSWWIKNFNVGSLQKVMKKDGVIFNPGYNARTKSFGVRPVMIIHKDNLLKFTR